MPSSFVKNNKYQRTEDDTEFNTKFQDQTYSTLGRYKTEKQPNKSIEFEIRISHARRISHSIVLDCFEDFRIVRAVSIEEVVACIYLACACCVCALQNRN
jgi:hypothetical protein